jgi:chromosome segregation ATPase
VVIVKKVFILLILMGFISPAYATTFYKWVDEKGVVNFTDDYNRVPPAFRSRLKTETYVQEETRTAAPSQVMVAKTNEAMKTDIYGRDETWWKEKVHPWKKQLREATGNYERVQKEYMLQAQGLSPFNFGKMSLTQYQILSLRLEILNNEMEMYQGQITEAKEMISKLSQEAKETKADPAWLE